MCGSDNLERYLDLGHTPPADRFIRQEQLDDPVVHFPLQVLLCGECGLSQLGYVVAPDILYQDEYPYEASTTRAGQEHWREFANDVATRFDFGDDPLAVDIGSNVGVLLARFRDEGMRVVGIDPAANIAAIANEAGIETLPELFASDVVDRVVSEHGRASVVTATNVFAHIDDLETFVEALDRLLAPDGIFVIEAPYLVNLISRLEYDTIYHEHLSYLSVRPLARFFERFGMRLFDVREVDIHGGSCRFFIDRAIRPVETETLEGLLAREEQEGLYDPTRLATFASAVEANRRELTELLAGLRAEGQRVVGVSAPAKGMTLLNYCRIGPETLAYVTEKSQLKVGRYTPGTHIRVTSDDELLADAPDVALLLAWNFADEIIENLSAYRDAGGKFIIPIPSPRIVTGVPEEAR
jgi:SAM-dependent methyltransferase